MNTYIIEARSLDQGYPVSKTITADSEKQAKKIFKNDFGDGLTLVNIFKVQENFMINYNLIVYIGIGLIVGGFCLFLYSQHRLRQLDIEEFKNQQLTKSFLKQKERERK